MALEGNPFRKSGFPPSCPQPQTPSNQGEGDTPDDNGQRTALSPSHSSPQLSSCPNHAVQHNNYSSSLNTRNSSDLDGGDGSPGTLPLASTFRLDGSHDSGFSSANNMYNINSQRTSHYESTDQLRSPATSEPGVISLMQPPPNMDGGHQGLYGRAGETADETMYHRHGGGEGGGSQVHGRGSNLHYGSLDRKQRNYKQEVYRDVSPMRFRGRGGQGEVRGDPERLMGSMVAPSGVILEVPVQHESNYGYQEVVGHPSAGQEQLQHHNQYGISGHAPSPHHCYSPSIREGSPVFHNVDVSHVHKRPSEQGLKSAHHTASQPVFHRIERSLSPSRNLPSQGQQQQAVHSYSVDRCPQPYQQSHAPSSSYGSDGSPHSIPIHHVSSASSYTPPPSSPVSSYPPSMSSPSSGTSSPRTPMVPTSHAPSSLVTVTRLQPHMEVTKPYETSDFYRYSEKLRRQRIIDQYQRQLIGTERASRSSTPQSVESDGHSTHSGSTSHHSGSTSHHSRSSPSPQSHPGHSYASLPPSAQQSYSRGPIQAYGRSSSAPLSSSMGQQRYQQYPNQSAPYYAHNAPLPSSHSYNQHPQQQQQQQQAFPSSSSQNFTPSSVASYPDGQITSSSASSYSIKSQGPGVQYAMQSSYKIQQVHSSTKHTHYQPPQPMTCRPVKNPPSFNNGEDYKS